MGKTRDLNILFFNFLFVTNSCENQGCDVLAH